MSATKRLLEEFAALVFPGDEWQQDELSIALIEDNTSHVLASSMTLERYRLFSLQYGRPPKTRLADMQRMISREHLDRFAALRIDRPFAFHVDSQQTERVQ